MKPDEEKADPRKQLIDRHLRISNDMYLLNIHPNIEERFRLLVNEPGASRKAIDLLKSKYRKPEIVDSWTPVDVSLFIAGITRFGRDWESVKSILPHKSAPELSQFYYSVWKGSRMYYNWKRIRKQRGLE